MKRFDIRYPYLGASLFVAGILLLGACGVSRPSYDDVPAAGKGAANKIDILASIERSAGAWSGLRATQHTRASFGSREFSSRMSMHCVRGEGIRLVLTPFPLIEAIRAWFTRDGITVVDVLGGRYAQESYGDISARFGVAISYEQVEALFLGRMFTHRGADISDLRTLYFSPRRDGGSLWSAELSGGYTYAFDLDARADLERAMLSRAGEDLLRVLYSGHFVLDDAGAKVPRQMTFVLAPNRAGAAVRAELEIEWSRASIVDPTELSVEPVVKPSYTRISIDQVLKMIKSK